VGNFTEPPIAWIYWRRDGYNQPFYKTVSLTHPSRDSRVDLDAQSPPTPLYATQTAHAPLLASDIVTMYDECPRCDADMIEFARAIERAHGIGT
jgi:hypothetical protein